jgi:hypothetical protein
MPLLSRPCRQPSDGRTVAHNINEDCTLFLKGTFHVEARLLPDHRPACRAVVFTHAGASPAGIRCRGRGKELINITKLDDQFKALLPTIMKSMKPAIVQNRADVERDYDALMPTLMAGMAARISELSDALVAIYSSNFTAEELRAVTALYRTPAGQKFLLKTPSIAQQTMAAGQKFGQSVGADAQKRMIEELRSKGYTL